jgi:hypothetical protein
MHPFPAPLTPSLIDPSALLSTLFSNPLTLCSKIPTQEHHARKSQTVNKIIKRLHATAFKLARKKYYGLASRT